MLVNLCTAPVPSASVTERARRRIPEATVARLPVYLRSLLEIEGNAITVSSERLAELAGVNAAKVRKDLGYLGHALANYGGFGASGFHVVALVDADPLKVGQEVAGTQIRSLDELPDL